MKTIVRSGQLLVLTLCLTVAAEMNSSSLQSGRRRSRHTDVISVAAPSISTQIYSSALNPARHQNAANIFRKNLGSANPVRWGKSLKSTANAEKFLSSSQWQNTRRDIFKNYGKSAQVRQYVDYQEYLFRKAVKLNNKAHFRSLDVKGNLAESIMDDFYRKDGWEIIDGKRGRNGFDGLYVKRTKTGRIKTWIAADAKSGNASLSMTARGQQLSPEWLKGNLQDLLKEARKEYVKNPSQITKQRIADLEQIMNLKGRQPRVMSMKLVQRGSKVYYQLKNVGVDGKSVSKPMLIDMSTGRNVAQQQLVYRNLEKHIAVYDKAGAPKLVQKIKIAIEKGKIKSDSEMYSFVKRNIPDKKLAKAVTQELGERPPRGSLAKAKGTQFAKAGGMIVTAAAVAGLIIAQDAMRGEIDWKTLAKAGGYAGGAVAVGFMFEHVTEYLAKKTAEKILRNAGKRITKKAVEQLSKTILKSIGGAVIVGAEVFALWSYMNDYNAGNMSQTDFMVYAGVTTLGAAGSLAVLILSTKYGAGLGTAFGPLGTVIGASLGVVTGSILVGYTYWVYKEKIERMEKEEFARAVWETKNNKEKFQNLLKTMKEEAGKLQNEAWNNLLTAG